MIDVECLFSDPNELLSENSFPAPRCGIKDFLSLLYKDYRIMVYTKGLIGVAALWCVNHKFDELLYGVINRKRRSYLYIKRN